jgi:single-stranded-DNA-specific exonuclease
VIYADAEVQLHKVEAASHDALQALEPHGHGNPKPVLVARNVQVQRVSRVGRGAEGEAPPHLKLTLKDAKNRAWDAVGWRMADRAGTLSPGDAVDIAFQLDVNTWNGNTRLQLLLLDWIAYTASSPSSA